jgi:Fe(3+) dicitrate transport protein
MHHLLSATARLLALIALLLLAGAPAMAQSHGSISGYVTDADTGQPLAGAHVSVHETTFGTVTDVSGRFRLEKLPAAPYRLTVSSIGYEPMTIDVRVSAERESTVRLDLRPTVLEFPELVVERASMLTHPMGMEGIPGSAHRVTTRSLAQYQQNDISRALRSIPGMNIQEEDGYGLRPNIGIRGTGSERSSKISLMEDGIPVAPAPYAAPAAYYFPSIGRMEEIEIRTGSSQIKYGPYTTGGALNLLSKSIPKAFSGSATVNRGERDNMTLKGHVGTSWTHGGVLIQAFNAQTDGFKQLDNGGSTGFNKTDILAKARVNTGPDARVQQALSVKYLYTDERSDETYLGLTNADFRANPLRRYAGSAQDEMDAGYEQVMLRHLVQPNDALRVVTTAYRSTFNRNWYKLDKVGSVGISTLLEDPAAHPTEFATVSGQATGADVPLLVKANNRAYLSRGVQSEVAWTLNRTIDLEAGVRIHRDEMDRFQWVDDWRLTEAGMTLASAGTPGTESNRIESARANAFYIQPRYMDGRVTIQPGLRHETITLRREDFGKNDVARTGANLATRENKVSVWIPGLGASVRVADGTTVFGGVHRGFAPPGSSEGTRAEKSVNWEVGARHEAGALRAGIALYYNDFSNLLGSDLAASGGTGSGDQFNGGRADVKGAELQLSRNLGALIDWRFSVPLSVTYSYTHATFGSSFESDFDAWGTVQEGDELPYIPRHQGSVEIGLEGNAFDVQLQAIHVGRMRTVAGQGDFNPAASTDRHFLLEASAGYTFREHVRVFAVMRNMTDEVYIAARRPAGLRPGLPRTTILGMTVSF